MKTIFVLVAALLLLVGCGKKSGGSSGNAATAPAGSAQPGVLQLDLSGAAALAVVGTTSSTSLDLTGTGTATDTDTVDPCAKSLFKVDTDGNLTSALSGCTTAIQIKRVFHSGSTTLLVFAPVAQSGLPSAFPLLPKDAGRTQFVSCTLGYVDRDDGVLMCLDDTTIAPGSGDGSYFQTDSTGSIFYLGGNNTAHLAVQKISTDTMQVTAATDADEIDNFNVSSSGDLTFHTKTVNFLRQKKADGTESEIANDSTPAWLASFPNSQLYVMDTAGKLSEVQNGKVQAASTTPNLPFGTISESVTKTTSGQMVSVTYNPQCATNGETNCVSVATLYPDASVHPITTIDRYENQNSPVYAQNGNNAIVAGTTNSSVPHLVLYDGTKETDLLPGQQVHVSTVAISGSTVYFSGVSKSAALLDDGTQAPTGTVSGTVDLSTLKVSYSSAGQAISQFEPVN